MSVYAKNAKNLEHGDELQMAIGLLFELLTNTTYLQSISTSINQVLDADLQLKLHLKLDEMRSLAMEARFCSKGKSGEAIAEFIEAYQSLLFSMYKYQILFNKMLQNAREYQWTLEQASEKLHEPDQRQDLFEREHSCRIIQDSRPAKQERCNSAPNTTSRSYMALRELTVYMLIYSSTLYLPIVQASYLVT